MNEATRRGRKQLEVIDSWIHQWSGGRLDPKNFKVIFSMIKVEPEKREKQEKHPDLLDKS